MPIADSDEKSPFLDWNEKLIAWWNYIPHWEQYEKMQYITFRLADSLPQNRLHEIQEIKDCFKRANPLPWDRNTQSTYDRLVTRKMNEYLDLGYGSCLMRDPEIRKVVSDAVEFHDGKHYWLKGYVVMPNHVHAVVEMIGTSKAGEVFALIKRYSAREINKQTGREGKIWNKTFDRLIRSEEHLKHCLSYILRNPRHLPPTYYTLGGSAFAWLKQ